MVDAVDVLFVDEAGQISLANVVAVARATDSLVLLGDPQQLDQPLKGTHPPGAERSALAHILGDAATMPPTEGLFLETTWRLHPDLCAFTSEVFYDGRLEPEAHLEVQRLTSPATLLDGTGPRLLDVPTSGADNASPDEAEAVAGIARSLVEGGGDMDRPRQASARPIGWDDVLIVAPYNAQVGDDPRRLPAGGAGRHGRQVPGPGGPDQHLLDDDFDARAGAARHGLPLQPPPAQRGDLTRPVRRASWSLRPSCSGSARGRPSRCAWRTRSAGSGRAELAHLRRPEPGILAGDAQAPLDLPPAVSTSSVGGRSGPVQRRGAGQHRAHRGGHGRHDRGGGYVGVAAC